MLDGEGLMSFSGVCAQAMFVLYFFLHRFTQDMDFCLKIKSLPEGW